MPLQLGDVTKTFADVELLSNDFKYIPKTSVMEGVYKFVNWFKEYYKV